MAMRNAECGMKTKKLKSLGVEKLGIAELLLF
jgi:hypothetical protein